jgi:hypothetical protein
MPTLLDTPGTRWRRLLWPVLLAALIHAVVLFFVRPPPAPLESTILQPLVYAAPPPVQAPVKPAARTHAPRRARPALPPAPPPPTPAEAAPDLAATPPAIPAPEPAAAEPPPAVAAAPQPAASAPPPPRALVPGSVRLKYTLEGEISHLAYHANGELLWAHDGQQYEARMEVSAFLLGSRVQSSRGRLTPQGLQPQRFVDRVRNDRVAEFDYDKSQIRFSDGPEPVPLPPDAQDQLSVFVQLGSLIAGAPQDYPEGTAVTLPAIGVYGPESWRVVVGTEEKLNLPGGEQMALRLTREATRADEPRVDVWLAPALGWLPVRIRLSQSNGDFIDQQWRGSEAP